MEDYAQKNGFTNIRHFTDDGVRGTTFKRPGLDAMLEEIRAGNVATVIIKDQSRIGRDVVEVGLLKRTFDEYHVRFIAANDNLDTANGFDIMSIFRDVINEWYVADTSRKIKTVFKSRMEKGLRCSGSVSYGYLASKENKGEWVIDEEAAAVVRRIFHSVVAGESIASIARALRAEKIPIPSEHWKRIGAPVRSAKYTDPYAWSTTTISYILKRPEYTGRKVLGKTVCENYKTKSTRKTAPEEQYIFDGEIPAIVDEETWNTVQRLMGTKRRAPKRQNTPNRLTGLLYCADCGAKLTHRSSLVQGKYLDDAFVCSSYRQLTRDCTMHYIPTAKMEAAILAAIQRVSWYVRHNEAEFIERVRKATDQHQENAVKEYRQKVSKAQRRYKELDGLVKKLYEGNATGKIPDKHFTRLLAEYDEEQTGLEAAIAQWQEAIESWNADRLKTDKFIELVSRYTDFSELTTPMLNEFIEKVVVHEGEGRGNSRRQRIDIYLNFIGAFEVPAHIVTPMEAEEQRRQQEEQAAKEARSQELAKAREEKRKAEKREFTARKKAGLLTPEEQAADEARLAHIHGFEADIKTVEAHPQIADGFCGMEIMGKAYTEKADAGEILLAACKDTKSADPVPLGSYRGFQMELSFDSFRNEFDVTLKGAVSHRVALGTDARGNITRLDNALAGILERLERANEQLNNLYNQQEAAKAEVGKPFPQEAELTAKSQRLAELDAALNMEDSVENRDERSESERPSVLADLKSKAEHIPPAKYSETREEVL